MSEREAARIGDAVLSWLVRYDLADAGNEYRAEDVVAILNDLAPYEEAAEITRLQKELETARADALEEAARLVEEDVTNSILDTFVVNGATLTNTKGHDTFMSTARVTELLQKRAKAVRALKDKEVAG